MESGTAIAIYVIHIHCMQSYDDSFESDFVNFGFLWCGDSIVMVGWIRLIHDCMNAFSADRLFKKSISIRFGFRK